MRQFFPGVLIGDTFCVGTPSRKDAGRKAGGRMQDIRRGMSDHDLGEERDRLENLDELSRCEEMRLEIVEDELARRQLQTPSRRQ